MDACCRFFTPMRPESTSGRKETFVAVLAERTSEPVRSFGSFTRDLHELAD